ncbi:MAG: T9SS type A sorting domain-containing protein [bacterium]
MSYIRLFFYRFGCILTVLSFVGIGFMQGQAIIAPSEDVFFYTFGGGEGCNTFLKYDITSVPSGRIIDSVFLTPYVYLISGGWNGNMDFWNVNDQDWNESDSCNLIWNLITSDSTHQAGGFGTAVGWTQSMDLATIFLTDYNVGNTYCSIKMKDPDEMTWVPIPGSYPLDYDDSLMVGDRAIGAIGYIVFYPHEWSNGPPWLNVFYHDVGVLEEQGRMDALTLNVYPNPFRQMTDIIFGNLQSAENIELVIYSVSGQLIRDFSRLEFCGQHTMHIVWDGQDASGEQLPPGVYFCRLKVGDKTVIEKICLMK